MLCISKARLVPSGVTRPPSARWHPADVEVVGETLVRRGTGDAGQAHQHLARAHIRQIAEGVHRHDVHRVGGVALRGDRGRAALALTGDLEGVHLVDAGGEVEVADHALAGRGGDRGADRVEADVAHDELVGARGDPGEDVAAGLVDEGADAQGGDLDAGALEQVAGRGVAHRAGEGGAAGVGGAGGRHGRAGEEGEEERARERPASSGEAADSEVGHRG
jgi:hypothetical protein